MSLEVQENVIERLRRRTQWAQGLGFKVRAEWLDGQEATWCEVGGVKLLFVDLSLPAADQIDQIDRSVADYQRSRSGVAA